MNFDYILNDPVFNKFPEKHKEIFCMYHGLNGFDIYIYTALEICYILQESYNISSSPQRVTSVVNKIYNRLGKPHELIEYRNKNRVKHNSHINLEKIDGDYRYIKHKGAKI